MSLQIYNLTSYQVCFAPSNIEQKSCKILRQETSGIILITEGSNFFLDNATVFMSKNNLRSPSYSDPFLWK